MKKLKIFKVTLKIFNVSQYLHFCLVPKTTENEPERELLINSYSRSSEIYSMFNDAISIPYRMENEYTLLTKEKADTVVKEAQYDLEKTKGRLELLKECYNSVDNHTSEDFSNYSEEYNGLVEYIKDLESGLEYVKTLLDVLFYDIEYSDFKEIRLFIG